MTYNLYLGADLAPLFAAPPGPGPVAAAGQVYNQVVQTDFPARAEVIAREIVEESPAVVGLQEVALWQTAPLGDPAALRPAYDFLEILLAELRARRPLPAGGDQRELPGGAADQRRHAGQLHRPRRDHRPIGSAQVPAQGVAPRVP